jgi:hypothetical protein
MVKTLAILLALNAVAAHAAMIQPTGYFVMQAVHNQNVPSSVLSSPQLSGIHIRDEWVLLEPAANSYSFAWIDGQVSRAAALHKQVALGIYAGNHSPHWTGAAWVDGIPTPWDSRVVNSFDAMVGQLGQRYANNPAVVDVHMSSPATNDSMEMYLPSGLKSASGYTDQKIIGVWTSAIDAYNLAFPNTALTLDLAMVPDSRGAITKAVDEYARRVLGERFNAIICNLKATTSLTAPHYLEIMRLHNEGVRTGSEMASASTDSSRFGGPFSKALSIGRSYGSAWWQVYQADVPKIPRTSLLMPAGIPEPSNLALIAIALFILACVYRRSAPGR